MDGIDPNVEQQPRILPLALIDASPTNPRKTFDEEGLRQFGASLRQYQLQAIVVRPKGERFELVAGERRWRAATLVGMESLRAEVVDLDDDTVAELQLAENAGREDVHPLEEAVALQARIDAGRTPQYLADRLGRPVRWVQRRLALMNLTATAREWLRSGRLPIAHAQQLAALAESTQGRVLARFGANAPIPTAREFARAIGYESHAVEAAPFDTTDKTLPGHGPCARCHHRSDAQADLFGDANTMALCLDAACWGQKVDATWLRVERSAEKRKLTVLTDAGEIFGYGDRLDYGAPYVDAPSAEGEKPVAVVRAPSGKAMELYAKPEKPARPAVREGGGEDEDEEGEGAAAPSVHDKWEQKRAAEEADERARITKLLEIASTKEGVVPMLRTALLGHLMNCSSRTFRFVMEVLGLPAKGLSDSAMVETIDSEDVLRALATTIAAEHLEMMDEDEEPSFFEAELLALMKGDAPAPDVDPLVELVGPQHWVPESDVEVLDPRTAVLWTPCADDDEHLRTVLPESMAKVLEEQLQGAGLPLVRRAPTGPSHVVRVGQIVRYQDGPRESSSGETGVSGFVREGTGPSGTVMFVAGAARVAYSDSVEVRDGVLVFELLPANYLPVPDADGCWSVTNTAASKPPRKSGAKKATKPATAEVEADDEPALIATTELRVIRGAWLQHRSGLRDTAKAALHKQWEPDGDDRVARVKRGSDVVSQVLAYCQEHKVALRLDGNAVSPTVEAPAAAPATTKTKPAKKSKSEPAPVAVEAPASVVSAPAPPAPTHTYRLGESVLTALREVRVEFDAPVGWVARSTRGGPSAEEVDRALRDLGGGWVGKLRAHVFSFDPSAAIAAVLESGAVSTGGAK